MRKIVYNLKPCPFCGSEKIYFKYNPLGQDCVYLECRCEDCTAGVGESGSVYDVDLKKQSD
jgi:hypothetical protein